jgi:hypothetical protein
MKNKKFNITILLLLLLFFIDNAGAFAQCAMCKTSVESDLANGGSIATGLNKGILYLMGVPYLALILGAYFFFKKPVDAKVKAWRDKHFRFKSTN